MPRRFSRLSNVLRPLSRVLTATIVAVGFAAIAFAAEKNLPVPRYVSLRADEVNLRTGPGERYPIEWVLTKKGLPVEITGEYEVWRKIRDAQGSEGWVHERMVTGTRNVVVEGEVRTLLSDPDIKASPVARAEPGVIAHLLECRATWCRIEAKGYKGWLRRSDLWGVYPEETVQ